MGRRADIEKPLHDLLHLHGRALEATWPHPWLIPAGTPSCRGWGSSGYSNDVVPCVDCGRTTGGVSVFPDGRRCWRCAFWRHMAWCPVAGVMVDILENRV